MSPSVDGWRERPARAPHLTAPLAGLAPAGLADIARWFFVSRDGRVVGADLEQGEVFFSDVLPFPVDGPGGATVAASDDGRFVAIAQARGLEGAVYDSHTARLVTRLARGNYHSEHCAFGLVFLDARRLVHAVEWNQLAVTDLLTGARLDPKPDHASVDYFFGNLVRAPSGSRLASTGWVWHPIGLVVALDVDAWLSSGAAEPSVEHGTQSEVWDLPCCWVDGATLVTETAGFPTNDVRLALHRLGEDEPRVTRPTTSPMALAMRHDELLSLGAVTEALSPTTLETKASLPRTTTAWHPGTQEALSIGAQPDGWRLISRPRSPIDTTSQLKTLALRAVDAPTFEARLVLADALEAAGHGGALVDHLRLAGPHGRRCHVVDDLAFG